MVCVREYIHILTYSNVQIYIHAHVLVTSFVLLVKWPEEEGNIGGAGGRRRGRARATIKTRTKLDHAVEADILSTGCTGHLLVVLGLEFRASRLGLRLQDWV